MLSIKDQPHGRHIVYCLLLTFYTKIAYVYIFRVIILIVNLHCFGCNYGGDNSFTLRHFKPKQFAQSFWNLLSQSTLNV